MVRWRLGCENTSRRPASVKRRREEKVDHGDKEIRIASRNGD